MDTSTDLNSSSYLGPFTLGYMITREIIIGQRIERAIRSTFDIVSSLQNQFRNLLITLYDDVVILFSFSLRSQHSPDTLCFHFQNSKGMEGESEYSIWFRPATGTRFASPFGHL
jgi:hypothetical protein